MKYTIGKLAGIIFGAIGLASFGATLVGVLRGKADAGQVAFGLFFGVIFAVAGIPNYRRFAMFQRQNFAWYAKTYPSSMVKGRVHCHSCSSDRVHVKNVMQHTYTRAHLCGNCGTTLFYSPEV